MERRTFIKLAGLAAFALPSIGKAAPNLIFRSAGKSCGSLARNVFEPYRDDLWSEAVIKVIGVGGCGGIAVDYMIKHGVKGAEFYRADTDMQALMRSEARTHLELSPQMSKGSVARANPQIGRDAAFEARERIVDVIGDADMLFLITGMGGSTGTGAAPVIAEIARDLGILTVAVVTEPFLSEYRGQQIVQEGMAALSKHVKTRIVVPAEMILRGLGSQVTFGDAFRATNEVLHIAVAGIAEIITCQGMIGVDFADITTVMTEHGRAMMGSAKASGNDRGRIAAERAVACPLLEGIDIADARSVLVNISASKRTFRLVDMYAVMDVIKDVAAESATVMAGTVCLDALGEDLRVTIVATGLEQAHALTK